nr:CCA tRNA nucleotidyltransferase [Paracoccus shandongensis]
MQDPALQSVFDAIEAGGHRAWLVGGAVRNALLGEPVCDLDLATDAPPDAVTRLAERAGLKPVPTGIDHGTVTVVAAGRGFEVTTLRRDVETDGRRAVVAFSDDLAQDAHRRDFTMNALYADHSGAVIDLVGGLDDLRARRLRFVGDPAQRIAEDYLRILRFFRFLAWYGRDADPDAVAACRDGRDGLDGISRERIGQELRKLLMAPDPLPAVRLMRDTGVLDKVLPGATPDRLHALPSPAPWLARLAALSQADLSDALRLSRSEARDHRILVTALAENWSFNRIAYRLHGDLADAAAALVQTAGPRPGWPEARAAARALPITASDLQPHLQGPALGRGLKAAEDAWIDSGFAMPPPALIDIALLAGETP